MSQNPVPEGAVVITPAEVYAKVLTLTEAVTVMLAKEDEKDRRAAETASRVMKVEDRQTSLERKVWLIAGLCAGGGGTAGSVVAQYLTK